MLSLLRSRQDEKLQNGRTIGTKRGVLGSRMRACLAFRRRDASGNYRKMKAVITDG
jgi:hypothetical protein